VSKDIQIIEYRIVQLVRGPCFNVIEYLESGIL
jgi:hypothetical protein